MSHIFETVTGTEGALSFKFNGQFALKNYNVEIVNGNRLKVTSVNNEMFSLLEADVSEVEINGTIYSDPNAAQLALTSLVYSANEPVVLTKEQYMQLASAIQAADRGKIMPDTPVPSGGWQPGWYTAGLFENENPGTIYPNQNNLKAKEGFITKFLYNGVTWDEVVYKIPKARKNNNFPVKENIIPYVSLTPGFYVNSIDGSLVALAGFSVTDYIDISDVSIIELDEKLYHEYAFFDKDFNYVAGSTLVTKKVRKPENVSFVRYTVKDNEDFYIKLFKEVIIENPESKLSLEFSRAGYYISASNGWQIALPSYSHSDFIPVKAGQIIRYMFIDEYGNHIVMPKHLVFFDTEFKFISGNSSSESNTVPQDGYFTFSTETEFFPRTILTINNPEVAKSKSNDIILFNRKNIKGLAIPNMCIVSQYGGGDFKTINEAVQYAKNIGNARYKFNILVMPGLYLESVDLSSHHINIIGTGGCAHDIIIKTTSGSYFAPPLNISARNSGENITCLGTNEEGNNPLIWTYGIHADTSGEGHSVWHNCNFLSEVNAGLGLGTKNNQQYEFHNCTIENRGSVYDGGGLYMHNSPHAGESDMSVLIDSCRIYSEMSIAVRIDDANKNAGHNDDTQGTPMTFINNNTWSKLYGRIPESIAFTNAPTTGDIGQIKIGERSFGNTVAKLNK
ncbi:hypothetical protein [Chryseobacterium sp. 2R14A]|uniref:hypothetical protein n=1 Tax=Chryseobacterium sp. 2R14A TaxID=3380353 RepID=UPI003CE83F1C